MTQYLLRNNCEFMGMIHFIENKNSKKHNLLKVICGCLVRDDTLYINLALYNKYKGILNKNLCNITAKDTQIKPKGTTTKDFP